MGRVSPKIINNEGWISLNNRFTNSDFGAAFSLKSICLDSLVDRKLFAGQIGLKSHNLITPLQTHSNNVVLNPSKKKIENCDGVFTNKIDYACSIQVADCMPLFFAHKNEIAFGLVHIGWRGLVNGIIKKTADLLIINGYHLKDFEIIIGPSIRNCCFEVSQDILSNFNPEFVSSVDEKGKYKIDLQGHALKNLINLDFKTENIEIIKECTYCDIYKYYSYRRDGEKAGRMIGLIGYK